MLRRASNHKTNRPVENRAVCLGPYFQDSRRKLDEAVKFVGQIGQPGLRELLLGFGKKCLPRGVVQTLLRLLDQSLTLGAQRHNLDVQPPLRGLGQRTVGYSAIMNLLAEAL